MAGNERTNTKIFPTALATDVLFYVLVDSTMPKNKLPVYGTSYRTCLPHAVEDFPDHNLVFIAADDGSGKQKWYFAADRENQDLYNWSFGQANIGGRRFDSVTRTYVIPRADFSSAEPLMGSAMPDTPNDLFTGSYVLADREQGATGVNEIDSLYVSETRTYVRRVSIAAVKMNDETGRVKSSVTNLYHRGETVSGTPVETLAASPSNAYWGQQSDGVFRELDQLSENWFAIIESNVIPEGSVNSASNPAKRRIETRVTPLGTDIMFVETGAMPDPVPEYGDAHYDTANWPDHKLSLITPADNSGLLYKFYYVANRDNQDSYNYEIIAGEQLVRTYIIPREDYLEYSAAQWVSAGSPASKWSYPPAGISGSGAVGSRTRSLDSVYTSYAFADDTLRRVGEEFDSLYVTIIRRFLRPTVIEYRYDDTFKKNIKITKEIIAATTTAPTIGTAGTVIEIQPGNFFHAVRITQELQLGGSSYPYAITSVPATQNYRFPSKLESVQLVNAWAYANSAGHRPSYSEDYYFKFKITDPRPGPYTAQIARFITDNPVALQGIYPLTPIPQPIRESIAVVSAWAYGSEELGNSTSATAKEWSVPETIHNSIIVTTGGDASTPASSQHITSILTATPGVTAFLALTSARIDYQARELPLGLFEVRITTIYFSNLYT